MQHFRIAFLFIVLSLMLIGGGQLSHAQSVEELRDKISSTQADIDKLNSEIAALERDLVKVGADRTSLEAAIKELNITRQKLLSDITLTQKKIEQTGYTIKQLGVAIMDKQARIDRNSEILANALRTLKEADELTLVETIFAYDNISELWTELDQLATVRTTVHDQLRELKGLKTELELQEEQERKEHENLSSYKSRLDGQRRVIEENKKQKDTLLVQTKSSEAQYQALLAEKQAARKQFETELQAYEAQLVYADDPTLLPKEGTGILSWPVEDPYITQGYGLTSFARSGAYGYDKAGNPNPHRGLDFRGSVGTPLLAVADGTVRNMYDMDKIPGCYSYGKWILIDHDNGLSSMYSHLSAFNANPGDKVKRGQVIGFGGSSGYSTGPHLHLTIFDQRSVKIDLFSWSIGCKGARIAYAPYEAYLNPLSYLPQ